MQRQKKMFHITNNDRTLYIEFALDEWIYLYREKVKKG